jgi:hypothetical protein
MNELFLQDLINNEYNYTQENFNQENFNQVNKKKNKKKNNKFNIKKIFIIIWFITSCYAAYLSWYINKDKNISIKVTHTIIAFIFGLLYNIYYCICYFYT